MSKFASRYASRDIGPQKRAKTNGPKSSYGTAISRAFVIEVEGIRSSLSDRNLHNLSSGTSPNRHRRSFLRDSLAIQTLSQRFGSLGHRLDSSAPDDRLPLLLAWLNVEPRLETILGIWHIQAQVNLSELYLTVLTQ